jgi:hypothetical protein
MAVATFAVPGPVGVAVAGSPPATEAPDATVPEPTVNEFIPEERAISDCISAIQKPGCGSESRSDWHQWLVFVVLVAGMAFVGWRVVAGLRRQRPTAEEPETAAPQARR